MTDEVEYQILKILVDEEGGKEVLTKFLSTYHNTLDEEKAFEDAGQVAERNGYRHFYGLSQINKVLNIILKLCKIYNNIQKNG
jgi:hypothetical protein